MAKKYSKNNIIYGAIFLVLLASTIFFFYQYWQAQDLLKNPQKKAAEDLRNTITALGKLMVLPNEQATLATVTDISKLAGQPFFINAQNGDKVIIFTQSKEAILYRPSANKIIAVSPISLGAPQATQSSQLNIIKTEIGPTTATSPEPSVITPTATENKINVAIYNGTEISGLAVTTEKKLTQNISQVKVVKTGDAINNYSKTEIVDVKGDDKDLVNQIAQLLSGKVVSSLPSGEVSSGADIVILLGK